MAISGSAWPFQAQRQRGFQVFLVKLSTMQQDLQTTTSQAISKLLAPSEIIDFFYVEHYHTHPAAFLGFCAHVFLGRESGRSRVKGLGRGWGFAASRARGLGASQTPVEQGWGLRSLPWKGAEASQTPPWSAPYIRPPTLYPLSSTLCVYLVASTR